MGLLHDRVVWRHETNQRPRGNWIEVFEADTEPQTFGVRLHLGDQSFELAYRCEDPIAADWYSQQLSKAIKKLASASG